MSNEIYTFQFRRPRLDNPTYLSNNVASSLSFYNPKVKVYEQKIQHNSKDNGVDFSLPNIKKSLPSISQNNNAGKQINVENIKNIQQQLGKYNNRYEDSTKKYQNTSQYKRSSSVNEVLNTKNQPLRNPSFSNFNQKDIFMKQGHNYNIITYQPKPYNQHIKKYPKLSLEEKDQYFRTRYINDQRYNKVINSEKQFLNPQSSSLNNPIQKQPERIAGKHTYKVNNLDRILPKLHKVGPNEYDHYPIVNRNYPVDSKTHYKNENALHQVNNENKRAHFDMKLLKNMDQLHFIA